jgi:GNAT superfamily N-acetyltransferase
MPVSQIVIRPMRDEDVPVVHAIHERAVSMTCAPLLPEAVVAAWLRDRTPEGYLRARDERGERFWIAEHRGLRAGFASWRGEWLMALFVDPDHQGNGIGRLLLDACDRDAADGGGKIARLDSTLNARDFYERLGFRVTGEGYEEKFGERVPHLEMLRL